MNWFQWLQRWFQVQLDELYRMRTLISQLDLLMMSKMAKYRQNLLKPSNTFPDSPVRWFQWLQRWFQVQLSRSYEVYSAIVDFRRAFQERNPFSVRRVKDAYNNIH